MKKKKIEDKKEQVRLEAMQKYMDMKKNGVGKFKYAPLDLSKPHVLLEKPV